MLFLFIFSAWVSESEDSSLINFGKFAVSIPLKNVSPLSYSVSFLEFSINLFSTFSCHPSHLLTSLLWLTSLCLSLLQSGHFFQPSFRSLILWAVSNLLLRLSIVSILILYISPLQGQSKSFPKLPDNCLFSFSMDITEVWFPEV